MRADGGRRGLLLAVAAAVAGGTLAVAWQRGKRVGAPVHTLAVAPAPPEVRLQGVEALQPTSPPAPPPPADLVDGSGSVHRLGEFVGSGLVVNLWATWCVPCVAELPALAALARRVKADGILVLAVSSDRGGAAAVEAFYRAHGIEGLGVSLDPKGAAQEAWGVRGIPTTLIVDRAGRERARAEGPVEWDAEAVVAAVRAMVG